MPFPGLDPSVSGLSGLGAGAPGPGAPGLPGGSDPQTDLALAAMQGLDPKSSNPTQALQQVDRALDITHQLLSQVIAQVGQFNPKVSKDLHTIARQVLATKLEIKKESPLSPPPDLMIGTELGGPGGGGPLPVPFGPGLGR